MWQKKVKVSFEGLCNLRSKAYCVVWSVNKHGTANRSWWGIWHVFDTTIHRSCKCLQYLWSANSTTTLDMCWQFVILNGLHRLVLGKWEGSLFNYLSIYLFIYSRLYLQLTVFLLSCCVNTVDTTINFLKFIEKSLGGTHTYIVVLVPSSSVFLNVY